MKKQGGEYLVALILLLSLGLFYFQKAINASGNQVIINQIMFGQDGGATNEFIELFNPTDADIDLAGFSLKKKTQSGTESALISNAKFNGLIRAHGYFLIAHPNYKNSISADLAYSSASYSISSNNSVLLYDANDVLFDKVGWGEAGDFEGLAAIGPEPGKSIIRKVANNSYIDSDNNLSDFKILPIPTPRNFSSPQISTSSLPEETTEQTIDNQNNDTNSNNENIGNADEPEVKIENNESKKAEIKIVEILPNPRREQEEFVEIYNSGNMDIKLDEWEIGNTKKRISVAKCASSTSLAVGKSLVIWRHLSNIPFYNDKGTVQLFSIQKVKPIESVKYDSSLIGQSYNYFCEKKGCRWDWSETVTPGEANVIKIANRQPQAVINLPEEILVGVEAYFDGSDSDDVDGDKLTYEWDFGDGIKNKLINPQHTYLKSGSFKISLTVNDGHAINKADKTVKVNGDDIILSINNLDQVENKIVINEIMPNPKGSDNQEWIELFNSGSTEIDLSDWAIRINEKNFLLPKNTKIKPKNFFLFRRNQGISLNNTNGIVQLLNQQKEIIDELEYEEAIEGESFAKGKNDKFFWTNKVTPGKENIIIVSSSKTSKIISNKVTSNTAKKQDASSEAVEITLEQVGDMADGELIKIQGAVAVLPGVFGSQYFYITEKAGLKIYNYKKDFPKLKIGDQIEVSGELNTADGEKRLKTKNLADIKIISSGQKLKPRIVACEELSGESAGSLVTIQGQLTKKTSTNIFLDDNDQEVVVLIKKNTGIKTADYIEGDKLLVTGIVIFAKNQPELLPRSSEDIKIISTAKQTEFLREPKVLGETTESDNWSIPARDRKKELLPYAVISVFAVIIITIIIYYKYKNKGAH